MDVSTDTGATRFARYAFPPNELGYCGPADPEVLLTHTTTGGDTAEVARRARLFDGAWVYLEVIAQAAGLDPLDQRVVDAYWIGNDLLADIDPAGMLDTVRDRLRGQGGGFLDDVPAGVGVSPHHGFHVFTVYPWARLLKARAEVPLSVLESCRIRWGTVTSVGPERVEIESRPLRWDGARLSLGNPRVESVRWSAEGLSLHEQPSAGDVVSMHWDWVCERLDEAQVAALGAATEESLALTNSLL